MTAQRVVLFFEKDEYMPIVLAIGHNLKEKNIYKCESNVILRNQDNIIIHKKCEEFDIFLTYCKDNLLRGFLYTKNGEKEVLGASTFSSLQIEQFCYDNICVVKLSKDPFST